MHNATELSNAQAPSFALFSRDMVTGAGADSLGPLLAASFCAPKQVTDMHVVIVDASRLHVSVYKSILPYSPSVLDIMWIRTPVYVRCGCCTRRSVCVARHDCGVALPSCSMIIGVLIVVGYQVLKRRNRDGGRSTIGELLGMGDSTSKSSAADKRGASDSAGFSRGRGGAAGGIGGISTKEMEALQVRASCGSVVSSLDGDTGVRWYACH